MGLTSHRNVNSSLNRGWTIGANYTTLINTIHCWAEDEDGNRMMVSVLPDSGAQQNVAHVKQLQQLNLKPLDLKDEARVLSGVEGGTIRLNLLSKSNSYHSTLKITPWKFQCSSSTNPDNGLRVFQGSFLDGCTKGKRWPTLESWNKRDMFLYR
jgi:hypothetical protein